MINFKLKSVILIIVCLIIPIPLKANTNEYYRIGLSKLKLTSSFTIKNQSIEMGYPQNNSFHFDLGETRNNGFTFQTANLYYIKIDEKFSTYGDAVSSSLYYKDLGHETTIAYNGIKEFYVYLGGYGNKNDADTAKSKIMKPNQLLAPESRRILLKGSPDIVFDHSQISPLIKSLDNNGLLILAQGRYRGMIEINRPVGKNLIPINYLTLDEYLYGVVPSEMPASWKLEALKAQAVAARTYAVSKSNVHKNDGYQLCDTVHCQVYKGYNNEAESSNQAVDETSGLAIYHKGKPIDAVFFASSGGFTEDSIHVWSNQLDYLRSVKEINETTATVWTRTFTLNEIDQCLAAKKIAIGKAVDLKIISYTGSGRVKELQIIGTNGSKSLFKEEIRTFFSPTADGSLRSRVFYISGDGSSMVQENILYGKPVAELFILDETSVQPVKKGFQNASYNLSQAIRYMNKKENNSSSSNGSFVLNGKGWGHGVGMSQEGARGMADLGHNFKEILTHYYSGVEIR